MENNVNKSVGSNYNTRLLAIMYGKGKGSSTGTSEGKHYIFDYDYFSDGTDERYKQLICVKDCTVTIKGFVAIPSGSYTACSKNAVDTSWETKIIGASRVYTTPFTDEATISLVAGDWLGCLYQGVSDKTDAGGCFLVYLPIE